MYLKNFHIKNFRCIEDMTVEFKKGVNVLIGENNTGKTTILDALRLSFSLGTQRRDIFFNLDDFFVNKYGITADVCEFDLTFADIFEQQKGLFVEMLALDNNEYVLKLHLKYQQKTKGDIDTISFKCWGGEHKGQNISYEMLNLFFFIHLEALRDAERNLRPNRENRLSHLLRRLINDSTEQERLARIINKKIEETEDWNRLITKAKKRINEHLGKTSINQQSVDINFLPLEFKKIAENLKMFIPNLWVVNKQEIKSQFIDDSWKKYFTNPDDSDLVFKDNFAEILKTDTQIGEKRGVIESIYQRTQNSFELSRNGLGYNNLIYIATVIGDLFERVESGIENYIALLIEEPEAHLHPQLQNLLFDYFKAMEEKSIQVFVTSHSPTITAKTNIYSITVLNNLNNSIKMTLLRNISLTLDEKQYLSRFLDVTKSQLFFAKGIILVEGISEALLLPIFADIMGQVFNLNRKGIEVVNIGGIAFNSFAKLFNSDDFNLRLNINCSIITDNDADSNGRISQRAQNTKNLEGGKLKVFLANNTFEYELYCEQNKNILINTYKELHERFNINTTGNIDDEAKIFTEYIKNNEDKAIFAQILAEKIKSDNINFKIPKYIQKAIKWAIYSHE